MSDFDAVLERLLTDPSFAASLAADPAAALAGYRLSVDEVQLLSAQVTGDAGGHRTVESRATQSSTFGLFAPLAGMAGIGSLLPEMRSGFGAADVAQAGSGFGTAGSGAFGAAEPGMGYGGNSTDAAQIGAAVEPAGGLAGLFDGELAGRIGAELGAPEQGFGAANPAAAVGGADQAAAVAGADPAAAATGFGASPATAGFGAADGATGGFGARESAVPTGPAPTDYRTRVDVDGDGGWDKHWYVQRDDGGVDIVADINRDGRADFVGHDYDRDGLVDAADYDDNRDGVFETHMFDDNGDGWMDREITSPGS